MRFLLILTMFLYGSISFGYDSCEQLMFQAETEGETVVEFYNDNSLIKRLDNIDDVCYVYAGYGMSCFRKIKCPEDVGNTLPEPGPGNDPCYDMYDSFVSNPEEAIAAEFVCHPRQRPQPPKPQPPKPQPQDPIRRLENSEAVCYVYLGKGISCVAKNLCEQELPDKLPEPGPGSEPCRDGC